MKTVEWKENATVTFKSLMYAKIYEEHRKAFLLLVNDADVRMNKKYVSLEDQFLRKKGNVSQKKSYNPVRQHE